MGLRKVESGLNTLMMGQVGEERHIQQISICVKEKQSNSFNVSI